MDHFERTELAELSGLTANGLNVLIARRQVPTLISDPGRVAASLFDALMMTMADLFARDGGYDRGFVANALHQGLDEFHHLAVRIDAGESGLCAFIGETVNRHFHVMGGNLQEIVDRLPSMPVPARMCIVSMSQAARLVRQRAKEANIEIGGFAMTKAEAAEIAANAFGRRSKRKMRTRTKVKVA